MGSTTPVRRRLIRKEVYNFCKPFCLYNYTLGASGREYGPKEQEDDDDWLKAYWDKELRKGEWYKHEAYTRNEARLRLIRLRTSAPDINIANEPATEPTTEPTSKPTSEPTSDSTSEPTSDSTSDPTSEPTSESISKPTKKPTTKRNRYTKQQPRRQRHQQDRYNLRRQPG